jgi:hypothetical protein
VPVRLPVSPLEATLHPVPCTNQWSLKRNQKTLHQPRHHHQLHFTPSRRDTSLFYYNKGGHILFVLIYVDDIIVASSLEEAMNALLKDLEKDFALNDLVKGRDGGLEGG